MGHLPFKLYYQEKLNRFESFLRSSFPTIHGQVSILEQSMKYSLFAGGKRIRPILLLTTVECAGINSDFALPFSAAIEYIHTYSLIHDDLPCMDNDELRRGIPTNHIKFGEDIALLAGDALLTHCFYLISDMRSIDIPPETSLKIIHILSEKSGVFGMVSGQIADIRSQYGEDASKKLRFIHSHKTGALLSASIQIGALLGNFDANTSQLLMKFGEEIGTCFQIQDDILDETGTRESLGKTPGSDVRNNTLTYPGIYGLERSLKLANQCYEKALEYLEQSKLDSVRLKELAGFILKRDY